MAQGLVARIRDMLETIDELEHATAGKTFEDYQRDWLLRKAAERGVEIISEASRHLPEDLKARHPYGGMLPASATFFVTSIIGSRIRSSGP
jgi:uncharacterized protein with HEPN domain